MPKSNSFEVQCQSSSVQTAATGCPPRTEPRGSARSRAAARSAASGSCSSCSTTTTPRPTPPSSCVTATVAIIGCGRGSFELTGLKDEATLGRPVREVLGLRFDNEEDPIGTSLEWGVRVLGREVRVEAEGDLPAEATADVFPAYDDDGGLLLVLTPKPLSALWTGSSQRIAGLEWPRGSRDELAPAKSVRDPADARLHGRLGGDHRHEGDQARSRPEGRRRAGLPGRADPAERGHARGDRPRDRHHAGARGPPGRRGARDPAARQRPDLGRPARREEPGARQGPGRHDRAALPLRLGAQRRRKPHRADQQPLLGGQARLAAPAADRRQQHDEGAVLPVPAEQDAGRGAGLLAPGAAVRVRRPGAEGLRGARGPAGHRGAEGGASGEPSERRALRALLRRAGQPRAARHRDQGPAPGERPDDGGADRHVPLHRRGPEQLPGGHPPPGRARADPAGAGTAGGELLPDLRDRPRPRARVAALHRLPREPGRDRRAHRGADRGWLQAPGGAGPRRRPEDRRAADRPEAHQRDPGLRLAREAGAARGPPGRRRSASRWC